MIVGLERLHRLLDYDPQTGVFTWKVRLAAPAPVGSVAGTIYANGRRYITIDRKRYFASRLAWFYVHGEWPRLQVDHRNMNRADDRIDNLRLATPQQNLANRRVLSDNQLGIKGVNRVAKRRIADKFRARIRVSGRLIHLGYFDTPEAAHAAYGVAAAKHFGEFARTA